MTKPRAHLPWSALLLAAVAGCADPPPPRVPEGGLGLSDTSTAQPNAEALPGPRGLPATVIAEITDASRELHFARHDTGGVLLTRKDGRFLAGPVPLEGGAPEGASLQPVADAPPGPSPVALVAHGSDFVLAWSTPSAGGDTVWAQRLGPDGKARGEPRKLGSSKGRVVWVDVLHAGPQAHVLWETEAKGSTITLAPVAGGEPVIAAEGAVGWHAASGPDAVAVGWVDGDPGTARVVEIGEKRGATVEVAQGASPDVLVAPIAGRTAVAWTTTLGGREPSLRMTWLDHGAAEAPPGAPVPGAAVGHHRLVSLLASGDADRVLLAWALEVGTVPPEHRGVFAVSATPGTFGPLAWLRHSAPEGLPTFAPDGGGFAVVTLAPMRSADMKGEEAAVVPTYARLGADLSVRAAEPIRVSGLGSEGGAEGVPALVRDLSCRAGRCTAIAQSDGTPSLIALATLPDRPSSWQPPVAPHDATASEALAELTSAGEVPAPLADLDAVELADGRVLVAWLTYYTGEGEPGPTPPGAVLSYRLIEKDGTLGRVFELSKRAISVGGVRLVALPAGKPQDAVAVIAWAGPNQGHSQIYLSSIRGDGKKKTQKTLTRVKRPQREAVANEVYDVDLAADGQGGFICVWSDSRDGNPEIYAAKVDGRLGRRGDLRRITEAAGASTEPRVVVRRDGAWVTWADRREDGAGIWLTTLGLDDLETGSATRVDGGEGVPRTPTWSADEGLALTWIEDPAASGGPSIGRLVTLDDQGQPASAVRAVRIAGGHVTSMQARCGAETCRGAALGRLDHGPLALGAFSTPRPSGAPVALRGPAALAGGTRQDLSLALLPDASTAFFFQDRGGSSIVRRLDLRWPGQARSTAASPP